MKNFFAFAMLSFVLLLSFHVVNENTRYGRMDDHELVTHTQEQGIHSSFQKQELQARHLIRTESKQTLYCNVFSAPLSHDFKMSGYWPDIQIQSNDSLYLSAKQPIPGRLSKQKLKRAFLI